MDRSLDSVQRYARTLGIGVQPRTVLVEGTTDMDLFALAAEYERNITGVDLFDGGFTVSAAGVGEQGGTRAVVRELVCLRAVARTDLLRNGRPKYRFVGLFDNDNAGRQAVRRAHDFDTSIIEFRDTFRLWPVLPVPMDLDPTSLKRRFEGANAAFRGLDWELEDLLPASLFEAFSDEYPTAIVRSATVGGEVHHDFSRDGKARFHRFVRDNAMRSDLIRVVGALKAMRSYLGLD